MEESIGARLKNAWNAFLSRGPTQGYREMERSSYYRPDRVRFTRGNERSIVTSVYNRIAMDVAAITIQHVRLDENGRFKETIDSGLNTCLNLEANIDQTGRALIQDAVMSMLDEGCIALVPVETFGDPELTDSYRISKIRVAKIEEWRPSSIKVNMYDERDGLRKSVVLSKKYVPTIENPLYSIMNEPNSTMQRLIRKLNLLDAIDEQSGSGKLDLLILS